MMEMSESKAETRMRMRGLAASVPQDVRRADDAEIARLVMSLPEYEAARTIFCFIGMKREISTDAIVRGALESGRRVAVPLCGEPGQMTAREIRSMDELSRGAYGILEPGPDAPTVQSDEIDLAVIPCVACSVEGARLGQGGGYYDRFIEGFRGASVMLCREICIAESVPTEPHDAVIPTVVSECGVRRGGKFS